MAFECYYQFLDRAVVDPLLALTWPEFQDRYGWRKTSQWSSAEEFLVDFAFDPPPERHQVAEVLRSRSLRWTMQRCSPQYFFLIELLEHAPEVQQRCPCVDVPNLEHTAPLVDAAVTAFLSHQLNANRLAVVLALHGGLDALSSLTLSEEQTATLASTIEPLPARHPIFRWQREDSLIHDQYETLRIRETRRFLSFLSLAWQKRWTAPHLRDDVRKKLSLPPGQAATFHESPVARGLLRGAKSAQMEKPCLLFYFGQ